MNREDFPILQKEINGKPIIYFDNACMALKPQQVIDKILSYYTEFSGCHGRSLHKFAARTSEEYEKARGSVAKLINSSEKEIIFTRNTTEAINIVAGSLGLKKGDKVVTTALEHNSNFIPWRRLEAEKGVNHAIVEVGMDGILQPEKIAEVMDRQTRLVSIFYTSNVTGTSAPVREIAKIAHDNNALLMLDGAQAVPHRKVDVKRDGIDFLAFSGHKMLGPTGIGALYGRQDLLEGMDQFLVGGETVKDVSLDGYEIEGLPSKFEAGLQNYAGAMGFGAAAEYLMKVGMGKIEMREQKLAAKMLKGMAGIRGIRTYGPNDPSQMCAIVPFTIEGISPHDIAMLLDEGENIMIRSGAHCTHYFHKAVLQELQGTARASLYFYNTEEELDTFFSALEGVAKHFA